MRRPEVVLGNSFQERNVKMNWRIALITSIEASVKNTMDSHDGIAQEHVITVSEPI